MTSRLEKLRKVERGTITDNFDREPRLFVVCRPLAIFAVGEGRASNVTRPSILGEAVLHGIPVSRLQSRPCRLEGVNDWYVVREECSADRPEVPFEQHAVVRLIGVEVWLAARWLDYAVFTAVFRPLAARKNFFVAQNTTLLCVVQAVHAGVADRLPQQCRNLFTRDWRTKSQSDT